MPTKATVANAIAELRRAATDRGPEGQVSALIGIGYAMLALVEVLDKAEEEHEQS